MKVRNIGKVSFAPITMGCMAVADPETWGPQDEKETIRAMHAARDLGIFSFDTAPGYGNGYSEELLGKAFHGSNDVVIATKVSQNNLSYNACINSCERSLKLLKRDCIDLLQIHWPNCDVPFEETARALIDLKKQGKIREYGVCNFGVEQLNEMMKHCDIMSEQLMYNLFFRGLEFELEDIMKEHKLGLLTYSSLAQGLLTGKYKHLQDVPVTLRRTRHYPCSMNPNAPHNETGCKDEVEKALTELENFAADHGITVSETALAWLLGKEIVTTVIAGARSAEQIEHNAKAMNIILSAGDMAELDRLSENIKQKLGANMDPWRNFGGPQEPRIH